ncbi:hypothetical protein A9W95_04820 [Mycobacterium sp. 1423905.2]|nr:hypothetical protein A9W95_04820 [Mycobacterium sp. 1423905.2]
MRDMQVVFRGGEAVASGAVTRHELRRWYRPIFPGVYAPKAQELSLRQRTEGAWLWSRGRAVIAGVAASALHGARWVDADIAIELISSNTRPPRGIVAREQVIAEDEATRVAGLPVTTLVRTAYDLGRLLPRDQAVARMDALMHASPFQVDAVLALAQRYPGARGTRRLPSTLRLVDGGAASPKESWLRLELIDAGFPVPTTQLPVSENHWGVALLDMGWPEYGVAVEYDGDQHRSDRRQYAKDQWRSRKLAELGWIVVRVIAEDRPADVIERVAKALQTRGWRPGRTPITALAG